MPCPLVGSQNELSVGEDRNDALAALSNICQLVQKDLCVCWAQEVPYVVESRGMYVPAVRRALSVGPQG